ncbi:N-formylglutamate amidohydrolase [Anianabacter salinae]|uniref:N-formylglutamate amidohydrolase n=1 Tax=Anianabacter salinae TaxID=2851023 RepID=UPI00225E5C18|nr:N-formylglutamate amidohydrolase [Anianabacter salinae]MBV0913753.1 N-formylglutamate amidohydrolase [Anianabacter salinae]
MGRATYDLIEPTTRTTSVIFASPHSGRDYFPRFLRESVLDEMQIRSSEDAFVDRLFADAPLFGAPLIAASAPRAFVDLNRSPDELDPALIEGVRRAGHNPRVTSGLGVVPRVVSNGRAIYSGKIGMAEAQARIEQFWHPYHAALAGLVQSQVERFGEAILIDCHSMPHEAIDSAGTRGTPHPEVVLGDRFGAAAGSGVMERVEAAFAGAGLRVVRNTPFAGAYTTQHYGRPSRGQHVIQVELDRALYMNERELVPHAGFEAFRTVLRSVIAEIVDIGRADLPLAAE